jgi:hypothetical protein
VGNLRTYSFFPHYEVSGDGVTTTITKYHFFNGQRIAMRTGTTLYYLHGDRVPPGRGSTSLATDSAGGVGNPVRDQGYYVMTATNWSQADRDRQPHRSLSESAVVFASLSSTRRATNSSGAFATMTHLGRVYPTAAASCSAISVMLCHGKFAEWTQLRRLEAEDNSLTNERPAKCAWSRSRCCNTWGTRCSMEY